MHNIQKYIYQFYSYCINRIQYNNFMTQHYKETYHISIINYMARKIIKNCLKPVFKENIELPYFPYLIIISIHHEKSLCFSFKLLNYL